MLEYILFGTFHMMNDIWYSSTATQDTRYITLATVYVRHIGVHYHCSCGNAFWEKQKGKSSKHNQKPIFSSIFMIIRFVNWSMQYYSWQTNTHPQFQLRRRHTNTHIRTHTHSERRTIQNWHFLNVNNMSPAPPNLEERQKEKGGRVSETEMTGEHFS